MSKILIIIIFLLLSAAGMASDKSKKNKHQTDQLQLQESIQRFYSRFTERIVDAENEKLLSRFRMSSIRQYTLYDSEALKIATSPYPEVNLLDMIVFVKANRMMIQRYWIPKVYGKAGNEMLRAFKESEADIINIAHVLLSDEKIARIDAKIADWLDAHPKVTRVEKFRVGEFSKYAKVAETKDDSFSFSNLLVDTKGAVKAVDQMVLVANRGIFLAQHMPLIVRMQARITAQEVLQDTLSSFQNAPSIAQKMEETRPMIDDLSDLTSELDKLARDSRDVLHELNQSFPAPFHTKGAMAQMDALISKSTVLIQELKSQNPAGKAVGEIKSLIWYIALMLMLVGLFISGAFWTGHYISKRLLMKRNLNETLPGN